MELAKPTELGNLKLSESSSINIGGLKKITIRKEDGKPLVIATGKCFFFGVKKDTKYMSGLTSLDLNDVTVRTFETILAQCEKHLGKPLSKLLYRRDDGTVTIYSKLKVAKGEILSKFYKDREEIDPMTYEGKHCEVKAALAISVSDIRYQYYSINPCIINWICDFLMDRQQRVKIENDIYSEWKDVVAGVPQGTKLGPWLFLVMINDLEISSANGNVIFVDDTYSFEIVEKDKSSLMQSMANEASLWSNDNMFQIQPKKCKELRISLKKIPGIYGNITINGNTIDVVRSVKILGVTLQSNLKWDEYIHNFVKKASKRLYFLSQLKRAKVSSVFLPSFPL